VSEEVNRKCRPRYTTIQLSTAHTDPEHHNAQRHRRTDRPTDKRQYDANSRLFSVRSVKVLINLIILE